MQLLGVASLDELEPRHVTQLARLMPMVQPMADAVAAVPARKAPVRKAPVRKAPAAVASTTPTAAKPKVPAAKKTAAAKVPRHLDHRLRREEAIRHEGSVEGRRGGGSNQRDHRCPEEEAGRKKGRDSVAEDRHRSE